MAWEIQRQRSSAFYGIEKDESRQKSRRRALYPANESRLIFLLCLTEVPRVLFLGLCLVFHYFSTGVVFPKFGFYFSRRAVAQALVKP